MKGSISPRRCLLARWKCGSRRQLMRRQLALIIQKRRKIYVCTANAEQKRSLFLTVSTSTFNLFRVRTKQCSGETPVVRLKSLLLCFRRASVLNSFLVSFHWLTSEILFLLINDECHLNVIMSGYPNMNLKFASTQNSPSNPICVLWNAWQQLRQRISW